MSGDQILYSPDDPAEIDAEYATCWSADGIATEIDISQYNLRAWTERQFIEDMVEQRCVKKTRGLSLSILGDYLGSADGLLENDEFIWPKELLPEDVRRSRIITWGYDSSVVKFCGASQASIFGHAENLISDLVRLREERAEETRPLIFVGHSLGGIVIKQALIRSFFYLQSNQDVERGRIMSSTKGVIFLGTPHRGSGKAALASMISSIIKIGLQRPNDKLLDTLAEESQILEEQASNFSSISNELRLVCFAEELPTGVGMIVPHSSATLPSFNARSGSIQENHMNMCKFSSRNDIGYKRVTQEIKDLIKKATREAFNVQDVLESLAFEGMDYRELDLEDPWARTFEWLAPGDADGPEDSSNDTERQSYQHSFTSWLRSSDPCPFWICGKAGSGKSTLMKRLFQQSDFREEIRKWAGASPVAFASFYFFNRGSSLLQKSQEGMVRAILHQIISQHHGLASLIEGLVPAIPTGRQQRGSTRKIDWDWKSLKKAMHLIKDQALESENIRLCLFLDGLDEYRAPTASSNSAEAMRGREPAAHSSKPARMKDYENLCQLVMDLASSANIKICVSSRDLNEFASAFGNSPMLRLEDLSRRDISTYVTGNLDTSNALAIWQSEAPDKMNQIVLRIIQKARGVFMWVKLVVEQILEAVKDGSFVEELTDFIEGLPDELDDLFSRMLDDIKPAYRGHSATLFQLVLTSEIWRPLTAVTLYFAEQATTDHVVSTTSTSPPNQHLDRIGAHRISTNMRKRLRSHSAGLIELSRTAQGKDRGPEPMSLTDPGFHVQFIHLTVNDLIERKGGISKMFGPTCRDSYHDSSMRLLRSSILGLSTLHINISSGDDSSGLLFSNKVYNWRFVHDAIHWARILDSTTGQDADEFATLLECLDAAGKTALDPRVTMTEDMRQEGATHWVASETQESGGRDYSSRDNFLSYMIQAGIENYARRKLQNAAPKRGKPYLEYALATQIGDHPIAMYTDSKSGTWDAVGVHPSRPSFIKFLLDHGADPNEAWTKISWDSCQRRTVWGSALVSLAFRLRRLVSSETSNGGYQPYAVAYSVAHPSREYLDQKLCIDHLKILIEYGANAGCRVVFDQDEQPATLGLRSPTTPSELIKALLPAQLHRLDLNEILEMLDEKVADRKKYSYFCVYQAKRILQFCNRRIHLDNRPRRATE